MKKFIKIDGVDFSDTPLPSVGITPEGEAMGYIPGWSFMADPDFLTIPGSSSPGELTTLDRVNGVMVPSQRSSPPIPEKTTINGQTFIDLVGGQAVLVYDPQVDINQDEWTIWAVLAPTDESNAAANFIVGGKGESGDFESGEISPALAYSQVTGNVVLYEWGGFSSSSGNVGPTRILAEVGLDRDGETPALVVATFSTALGLRIRVNGSLAASEPGDTRPFDAKFEADEYRCWRSFRGKQGMVGIIGNDLSKPENSGYRRAIEEFLMNKYGIIGAS